MFSEFDGVFIFLYESEELAGNILSRFVLGLVAFVQLVFAHFVVRHRGFNCFAGETWKVKRGNRPLR